MTAERLRHALKRITGLYPTPEQFVVIEEAARTIALPILEADEKLVERIAGTIWKLDPQRLTGSAPDYLTIARAVLDAQRLASDE